VDSIAPIDESGDEAQAGEEISGELVVSGGDAAPIFEATPQPLDEVSLAIGDAVVGDLADARRTGWNDSLGAARGNQPADGIAVVAAVGDEPAERSEGGQKRRRGRRIGSVAGG